MRILSLVFFVLLACNTAQTATEPSFEHAADAEARADFKLAAKLFAEVGTAEAEIRLANIEWRVFENFDVAEARLKRVTGEKTSNAQRDLVRLAMKRRDFAAARKYADAAIASAEKARDRRLAVVERARVVVEDPLDAVEVRRTITALREVVAVEGPMLQPSRLLVRAGLLAGDGAAVQEGVDGYYHVSEFSAPPHLVATAHASLKRLLPSWRGGENADLAEALAGLRFFKEAALVAPRTSDIAGYAAALRRLDDLVEHYYRDLALGRASARFLRNAVKTEIGDRFRRFQPYVNIGETGGRLDLHMAHPVIDRKLQVEQEGKKGTVRFVALDGVVSNGFWEWAADGRSGDGGWGTAREIYQVRSRYANGPLHDWLRVTDAEVRAEDDRKIAEESARDAELAKQQPIRRFAGLVRRLDRQYLEKVYAETRERDAFLARVEREEFHYSIELHEGRHAIDDLSGDRFKVWELEYRGKRAQVAYSDAARSSLASVLGGPIANETPHGKAATKFAEGFIAWMRAHAGEIAGLDVNAPLLPQADKLTDAQIKAAALSLPPR